MCRRELIQETSKRSHYSAPYPGNVTEMRIEELIDRRAGYRASSPSRKSNSSNFSLGVRFAGRQGNPPKVNNYNLFFEFKSARRH
ncbi:hypothetical protein D5086_016583 [Populus alba]|uniref:Uncharacterized protein n=1 Tax=Populus alba TaxID=43335 RepID=A0ACC4BV31_POPAL